MKKVILSGFGILFVVSILICGCSKPEEKKVETPPVQEKIVQEKAPAVKQEMVAEEEPVKEEPTEELATMVDQAIGPAAEINANVDKALEQFKKDIKGGDDFLKSAKGVLVFPSVFKAGVGVGGEYGEGALRIDGKTVDYYNTVAASIGLQVGAQTKRIIIVFMEDDALKKFRESKGWRAGVDGSIALINLGGGDTLDTTTIKDPIVGFVFGNKGLMINMNLEGSKFTKILR
jgi:lipid-binding SYLF domain-containing protein